MIEIKTKIGAGCPAKEGKASAHGEPLGVENVAALRANLGIADNGPFVLDQDVYDHFAKLAEEKATVEDAWNALFADYCKTYPEMKELWDNYHNTDNAKCLYDLDEFWNSFDKPEATRNVSGKLLNIINNVVPNMFGGAADLAPSTKTNMKDAGDFSKENPLGKNIHFGIREIAMAAIGNGIALHGGLRPFVSTFFVFSDYVKPMARLSALMGVPLTYVLTHDSIGVGEDGPTHEPIEQLAMLRAMPNFYVYRPADATECAAAWYFATNKKDAPTALVLSRQNLPQLDGSSQEALKGGYILEDSVRILQMLSSSQLVRKFPLLSRQRKSLQPRILMSALSACHVWICLRISQMSTRMQYFQRTSQPELVSKHSPSLDGANTSVSTASSSE